MLVTNDSLLSLSLVLAVQTVKRKCQKLESETSLKRSSRRCCFLRSICLTATLRPVLRSTAVQTIPVDPSPIFTKLSKARRGSPRLTTDSIALRNCNKMQQLSQTSALEVIQRIRGYFYNDMHYINLCFTYLPTYLLTEVLYNLGSGSRFPLANVTAAHYAVNLAADAKLIAQLAPIPYLKSGIHIYSSIMGKKVSCHHMAQ